MIRSVTVGILIVGAVISGANTLIHSGEPPRVVSRVCVQSERSSYPSFLSLGEHGEGIWVTNYVDNCVRYVPQLPDK